MPIVFNCLEQQTDLGPWAAITNRVPELRCQVQVQQASLVPGWRSSPGCEFVHHDSITVGDSAVGRGWCLVLLWRVKNAQVCPGRTQIAPLLGLGGAAWIPCSRISERRQPRGVRSWWGKLGEGFGRMSVGQCSAKRMQFTEGKCYALLNEVLHTAVDAPGPV